MDAGVRATQDAKAEDDNTIHVILRALIVYEESSVFGYMENIFLQRDGDIIILFAEKELNHEYNTPHPFTTNSS